jgi:hypothetical protein
MGQPQATEIAAALRKAATKLTGDASTAATTAANSVDGIGNELATAGIIQALNDATKAFTGTSPDAKTIQAALDALNSAFPPDEVTIHTT